MASDSAIVKCPSCQTKNRVPAATKGVVQCASCHQGLPYIVDADEATFDERVNQSTLPVVVDLWAPWCGPCRTVSPLLVQLAETYAGKLKLVKVNVDNAPSVQARFGVQGIPTFILLNNGTEIGRLVGAHPLGELQSWVDQSLAGQN